MRMDETLRKIGMELRRRYESAVRRRMDWPMIDAFARLQEREETELAESEENSAEPRGGKDVPDRT